SWGEAFGIFDGYTKIPHVFPTWKPMPIKYPIYTGKTLVASGRWRKVDHRDDLLDLFPRSPEIFHRKSDHPSNTKVRTDGSAEAITGEMRELTNAEANHIGLNRGDYRQIMLEEQFERYLAATLT